MDKETKTKFEKVVVLHNLGLGDHIICNGLVRTLVRESFNEVILVAKRPLLPTVKELYEDCNAVSVCAIEPRTVQDEVLQAWQIAISNRAVFVCLQQFPGKESYFDEVFYKSAGVPFEKRWSEFHLPPPTDEAFDLLARIKSTVGGGKFAIAHIEASIGSFPISINSKLPVVYIKNGVVSSLISWRLAIEAASEVYCIDSSVIHFADSLSIAGKKLVYFDVGRGSLFRLLHPWTPVKMPIHIGGD